MYIIDNKHLLLALSRLETPPKSIALFSVNVGYGYFDSIFHVDLEQLVLGLHVVVSGEPYFSARLPLVAKFQQLPRLQLLKVVEAYAFIDIFGSLHRVPVISTLRTLELYDLPSDARGSKLLVRALEAAPNIQRLLISHQPNDKRSARLARATAFFTLIVRSSRFNSLALGCDGDALTIATLFHRRYMKGASSELHSFELLDDYSVSSLLLLLAEIVRGNEISIMKQTDTFLGKGLSARHVLMRGAKRLKHETQMGRMYPNQNHIEHYLGKSLPLSVEIMNFLTDESTMGCSFDIRQIW